MRNAALMSRQNNRNLVPLIAHVSYMFIKFILQTCFYSTFFALALFGKRLENHLKKKAYIFYKLIFSPKDFRKISNMTFFKIPLKRLQENSTPFQTSLSCHWTLNRNGDRWLVNMCVITEVSFKWIINCAGCSQEIRMKKNKL